MTKWIAKVLKLSGETTVASCKRLCRIPSTIFLFMEILTLPSTTVKA